MDEAIAVILEHAFTNGGDAAYQPILDAARDAQVVLLGEATHGTHEFYAERARITQLLIAQGFEAVAVEGDWPDAFRVSRWVTHDTDERDAAAALAGFERFPRWLWRNTVVVELLDWLRATNAQRARPVGFFGLDMYSMHTSMAAVLAYLDGVDPAAAARARRRYGCFELFGDEPQRYGLLTTHGRAEPCEDEAVRQLVELRRALPRYAAGDGRATRLAAFAAEQNARLVTRAEQYYRAMFRGRDDSWNLRDSHMHETLEALRAHLVREGGEGRVVVWAHNSHVGDARATQMGRRGEHNLGQLVRQAGTRAVLVGFTTYRGTVTAASSWDDVAEYKRVRPGLAGSWERLFHDTGRQRFVLPLGGEVARALAGERLERAIGVLYLPETERQSHYFAADLTRQLDLVIHLDQTRALEPLERSRAWQRGRDEPPETYPSGL